MCNFLNKFSSGFFISCKNFQDIYLFSKIKISHKIYIFFFFYSFSKFNNVYTFLKIFKAKLQEIIFVHNSEKQNNGNTQEVYESCKWIRYVIFYYWKLSVNCFFSTIHDLKCNIWEKNICMFIKCSDTKSSKLLNCFKKKKKGKSVEGKE